MLKNVSKPKWRTGEVVVILYSINLLDLEWKSFKCATVKE